MSATTTTRPLGATPRLRAWSLARSEWTKIRSVRSTVWTILAMTIVTLGIASVTVASHWITLTPTQRATFDPTMNSLRGLLFAEFVVGVLGVLVMSAEYGTGTIRATLTAVPSRVRVLATKVGVFAVVTSIIGETLSFGAFFVGQALLARGAPHAALSQPGVLRAVVGEGLVIMALGLLALGFATIIRHTAGAIATFTGFMFVIPFILQALPSSIGQPVLKFTLFNISGTMVSVTHNISTGPTFAPWTGLAMLCGYAVASLLLGGWLMVRRDS